MPINLALASKAGTQWLLDLIVDLARQLLDAVPDLQQRNYSLHTRCHAGRLLLCVIMVYTQFARSACHFNRNDSAI
jgi:hypothetical protein